MLRHALAALALGSVRKNISLPSGRSFLFTAPPPALHHPPRTGWPLLIALHGLRDGNSFILDRTGFDTLAPAQGFVVVAPLGDTNRDGSAGGSWSLQNERGDGLWVDSGSMEDDVIFLLDVASWVATQVPLSGDIFLAGLSQGGKMSCRLACAHLPPPWRVRALALAAGVQGEEDRVCHAPAPIPTLIFWGGMDAIVPLLSNHGVMLYHAGLTHIESWQRYNGCPGARPTPWCPAAAESRSKGSVLFSYDSCPAPMLLSIQPWDAHVWPRQLKGVGLDGSLSALAFFADVLNGTPPAPPEGYVPCAEAVGLLALRPAL